MAGGQEIGKIYYSLNLNDDNFTKGLGQASKQTSNFGDSVKNIANKTAIAMGVAGAGLTLFAKSATDRTVELVKGAKMLSREIGVTTTEASRLTAAFGRMGITADDASKTFGIFSKQIVATKNAADPADTALGKFGITVKDASGNLKPFNDILFEVADKFKTMPNGPEKTAEAMALFGRSGKDMIKVLNLGSDGIAELEKKADKLGLTLNPNTINAVEGLVKSQKDLKQQTDILKIAVGTATAPVLTEFNKKINELLQSLMNTDGPMKTITTDVLAFGGPILTAGAGVLTFGASMVQGLVAAKEMGLTLRGLAAAGGPFALIGAAAGIAGYFIVQSADKTKAAWDNASTAATNASNSMKIAYQEIEDSALSKSEKVRLLNQIADQSNMQSASTFHYVWNYATTGVRDLFDSMVNGIGGALSRLHGNIVNAVANALNTVTGWAGSFYDAGYGLIRAFANGIAGAVQHAVNAVHGVLSRVRNLLPFSDAKEGPLSDLTKSGQKFSETFASGIARGSGAIHSAATNALGYSVPGSGAASVSGGSNSNYQFGDLHFHTAEAVDRFTNYISDNDRSLQLEGMGLSPL